MPQNTPSPPQTELFLVDFIYMSLDSRLGIFRGRICESIKKIFFLQGPSEGEQERLGPRCSIRNTAGSVFLQRFDVNTCKQSL